MEYTSGSRVVFNEGWIAVPDTDSSGRRISGLCSRFGFDDHTDFFNVYGAVADKFTPEEEAMLAAQQKEARVKRRKTLLEEAKRQQERQREAAREAERQQELEQEQMQEQRRRADDWAAGVEEMDEEVREEMSAMLALEINRRESLSAIAHRAHETHVTDAVLGAAAAGEFYYEAWLAGNTTKKFPAGLPKEFYKRAVSDAGDLILKRASEHPPWASRLVSGVASAAFSVPDEWEMQVDLEKEILDLGRKKAWIAGTLARAFGRVYYSEASPAGQRFLDDVRVYLQSAVLAPSSFILSACFAWRDVSYVDEMIAGTTDPVSLGTHFDAKYFYAFGGYRIVISLRENVEDSFALCLSLKDAGGTLHWGAPEFLNSRVAVLSHLTSGFHGLGLPGLRMGHGRYDKGVAVIVDVLDQSGICDVHGCGRFRGHDGECRMVGMGWNAGWKTCSCDVCERAKDEYRSRAKASGNYDLVTAYYRDLQCAHGWKSVCGECVSRAGDVSVAEAVEKSRKNFGGSLYQVDPLSLSHAATAVLRLRGWECVEDFSDAVQKRLDSAVASAVGEDGGEELTEERAEELLEARNSAGNRMIVLALCQAFEWNKALTPAQTHPSKRLTSESCLFGSPLVGHYKASRYNDKGQQEYYLVDIKVTAYQSVQDRSRRRFNKATILKGAAWGGKFGFPAWVTAEDFHGFCSLIVRVARDWNKWETGLFKDHTAELQGVFAAAEETPFQPANMCAEAGWVRDFVRVESDNTQAAVWPDEVVGVPVAVLNVLKRGMFFRTHCKRKRLVGDSAHRIITAAARRAEKSASEAAAQCSQEGVGVDGRRLGPFQLKVYVTPFARVLEPGSAAGPSAQRSNGRIAVCNCGLGGVCRIKTRDVIAFPIVQCRLVDSSHIPHVVLTLATRSAEDVVGIINHIVPIVMNTTVPIISDASVDVVDDYTRLKTIILKSLGLQQNGRSRVHFRKPSASSARSSARSSAVTMDSDSDWDV